MTHVLILYHSHTQRTKAMAALVARGAERIKGTEIRLRSIDDASYDDILWCDALAVGSPTNLGSISWEMKKFWDEMSQQLWGKIDGKIACAFSSSGSYGGGSEIACLNMLIILINYGFLAFGVTDYSGDRASPHYGAISAGLPESLAEKQSCLKLGERLAQWAAVFIEQRSEEHPHYSAISNSTQFSGVLR
ncbi:flavodoxin domain-containing protein [soil metagenome]